MIIATGARANYLGLESEEIYKNRGVSACAVCDGALPRFRNKPLVVVGGGDSAVEEADYLSKFASVVHMVHRRDELRASKIMAERAINNPKIKMLWNCDRRRSARQRQGRRHRRAAAVDRRRIDARTRSGRHVRRHRPHAEHGVPRGQARVDGKKYIKWTVPFRTNTSVDGVFAAGDVADDYYRQAVTAAGTGCMAALDAERWLAAQGL